MSKLTTDDLIVEHFEPMVMVKIAKHLAWLRNGAQAKSILMDFAEGIIGERKAVPVEITKAAIDRMILEGFLAVLTQGGPDSGETIVRMTEKAQDAFKTYREMTFDRQKWRDSSRVKLSRQAAADTFGASGISSTQRAENEQTRRAEAYPALVQAMREAYRRTMDPDVSLTLEEALRAAGEKL